MSNNQLTGGYQAASVLSANAGRLAVLHSGDHVMVGVIEDVTTPHGVNISTWGLDAFGYTLPIVPLEQPGIHVEILPDTVPTYLAAPHRDLLSAMYEDWCQRHGQSAELHATLNAVYFLEQQGILLPDKKDWPKVDQLLSEVHEGYYSFVRALAGRLPAS